MLTWHKFVFPRVCTAPFDQVRKGPFVFHPFDHMSTLICFFPRVRTAPFDQVRKCAFVFHPFDHMSTLLCFFPRVRIYFSSVRSSALVRIYFSSVRSYVSPHLFSIGYVPRRSIKCASAEFFFIRSIICLPTFVLCM